LLNVISPMQLGWGSSGGSRGQKLHAFNFACNTETGKRQTGYGASLEFSGARPATTSNANQWCYNIVRKLLADTCRRKWIFIFRPRHNSCGSGEASLPDLFIEQATQ